MWGIIPAAGVGSRIQPLAFSKELLPVGSKLVDGSERPKAVSAYLVERMLRAGARKLCFVISPGKSDIVEYYVDVGTLHGYHEALQILRAQELVRHVRERAERERELEPAPRDGAPDGRWLEPAAGAEAGDAR